MAKSKESTISMPVNELAAALAAATASAIETARPQKKTISTRKKNTPWSSKDGSPKLKLKRKFYQHGIELTERKSSNEEIALMNKVRPGVYCNGFVKVVKRRDKGVDIDYPVKTASQRLKLITEFGIRSFTELLQYCITEAAMPKRLDPVEDDDA